MRWTWSEARFRRRSPRSRPPLVIGHRGVGPAGGGGGAGGGGVEGAEGRAAPPENTLAAFEEAARQGADAIELDARLCASGEVVVLHDADLRRPTRGADPRAVGAVPWGELRRVDVGGERVPLLADALALARARRLAVNVEVKRDVPDRVAMVRAMARLLRGWDPAHAVLVS
jgi:glycerophosphoryl diester phosphodiesterase